MEDEIHSEGKVGHGVRARRGQKKGKEGKGDEKQAKKEGGNGHMRQSEMSVEIAQGDRTIQMKKKRAFLVFSHLHYIFTLKALTPHIAYEIFLRIHTSPTFQHHPSPHLHCVSIYLAMKYHEIYPPTLQQLQQARNWNIDVASYRKMEEKVVYMMDGNLNVPTWLGALEMEMGECGVQQEMMARFLMEIVLVSGKIDCEHSRQSIIQAIVVLTKNKSNQYLDPALLRLCRTILHIRSTLPQTCPFLYHKYSKPRFSCVSLRPLPSPK